MGALLELRRQPPELIFRADLRIQLIVVDDVVAVLAAGAGFQDGRGIAVADAELPKIGNQLARVFEAKIFVELQPVGGKRNRPLLLTGQPVKAFTQLN